MIYFTSDPHAYHKNICRGTTSWDKFEEGSSHQNTRDFDTPEEMTQAIVKAWNERVKWDDELWILGDIAFGGHANIKRFMDQIHCKNVHLIFGNHDQHIEPLNSPYRELFKSCQYYKELSYSVDNQKFRIILSHYAFRVWNKSHHNSIHLYGHSHGTLPGFGKSMDVGVDTNNLYPYSLTEIKEKFKNINTPVVDHHTKHTN